MVTAESASAAEERAGDRIRQEQRAIAYDYGFVEFLLRLPPDWKLTYERLFEIGELNDLCQVERSAEGALILSAPPPAPESGWIESVLTEQNQAWASQTKWRTFSSTFGYKLPDGSLLVPNLSCMPLALIPPRSDPIWDEPFALVPPFLIETRSPSQSLASQQRKMARYIANGGQLGWLIDPRRRQIHIYRTNQAPEILDDPKTLSGEDVMEGLVVDLSDLWP
jgi:Uma2 family endonuclease